jgi:hypothetical protein
MLYLLCRIYIFRIDNFRIELIEWVCNKFPQYITAEFLEKNHKIVSDKIFNIFKKYAIEQPDIDNCYLCQEELYKHEKYTNICNCKMPLHRECIYLLYVDKYNIDKKCKSCNVLFKKNTALFKDKKIRWRILFFPEAGIFPELVIKCVFLHYSNVVNSIIFLQFDALKFHIDKLIQNAKIKVDSDNQRDNQREVKQDNQRDNQREVKQDNQREVKQTAELKDQNSKLKDQNSKLKDKNSKLKDQVGKLLSRELHALIYNGDLLHCKPFILNDVLTNKLKRKYNKYKFNQIEKYMSTIINTYLQCT